jgi:hypothetical protein
MFSDILIQITYHITTQSETQLKHVIRIFVYLRVYVSNIHGQNIMFLKIIDLYGILSEYDIAN